MGLYGSGGFRFLHIQLTISYSRIKLKKILFFKLSITDLFINNIIQKRISGIHLFADQNWWPLNISSIFIHWSSTQYIVALTSTSELQICCGFRKLSFICEGFVWWARRTFFEFFLVKNIAIRSIFTDFIWIFIHKFTYNFR